MPTIEQFIVIIQFRVLRLLQRNVIIGKIFLDYIDTNNNMRTFN